jgi:HlyD family secretion protein
VRSTVQGTVLDVPVKEGASVIESNTFNAGSTIAFVADMGDMIFEGKVDESEVGKIKEGMPLNIRVGALDNQAFEGKLEYISPKGRSEDGAIQFEIKAAIVPREGVMIRAGYSANADIVLDSAKGVLAVNERLLVFEGEKVYIEVETGPQKFERRELEVGLSDGINIEVKSGLALTDKVKGREKKKK